MYRYNLLYLTLVQWCYICYGYNERYPICTETVRVTTNDFLISPISWSLSDANCSTTLERGLFEEHSQIIARVFRLSISNSLNYGCIDKLWFSYPDSGVTIPAICRRSSLRSIFQAVGKDIGVHMASATKSGAFEINLSVSYVREICTDDILDLSSVETGHLKTKNYPLYDITSCTQTIRVNPGQRIYFSFLDQKDMGCDDRRNCDTSGYLRVDGDCGCINTIILSELHEVKLEYHNTATKPGRMLYFEVYGCKISDMNITNAQAAMIAGTYNCEIQCNIGYVMSQETKVDSIVSTCNFNWETWSVKSVQCEPIDCGEPPSVGNGTHTHTTTIYGSTAKYRCDYRFIPDGNRIIECQSNGEWETPLYCEYTNSTMSPEEFDMFYTTTLDFTLMDGVVVDKTGNYSIQATEPTPLDGGPQITEERNHKVGVIVGGVIAALIAVAILLLIAFVLYKRKKQPSYYSGYNGYGERTHNSYAEDPPKPAPAPTALDNARKKRNSKTMSSARPYDAWEASLSATQQPVSMRVKPTTDDATMRRMSAILSSDTWKTASSGTVRMSDPNPRPSSQPFHNTVSGRMRSDSRIALIDSDFYNGHGTFQRSFSIAEDPAEHANFGVPAQFSRPPVPACFRNDALTIEEDLYDTANDAVDCDEEGSVIYDVTPATAIDEESDYDYVASESSFDSDHGDDEGPYHHHHEIIDLRLPHYEGQPDYDHVFSGFN